MNGRDRLRSVVKQRLVNSTAFDEDNTFEIQMTDTNDSARADRVLEEPQQLSPVVVAGDSRSTHSETE